jgi:bile acid:Na+ symporter, BASS family
VPDLSELFFRYEYSLAAAQLAFAMVGMGATLTVGDFGKVLRVPRGVTVGLAVQLLLIPGLAVAVSHLFALEAGLAVGLLLVAAVPGGSMSNVFTYFARGNLALSIVLTAVTTLACLVTTPIVLRLLMGRHLPAEVDMPEGQISFEIGFFLLGPLALGMLLGARLPAQRAIIARWGIRASVLCILLIAAGSIAADRVDAAGRGAGALLAMLAFAFAALQAGLWSSWLAGLPRPDRIAIGIETTIRNTNLGLLIKASLFPAVPGVDDPIANAVLFVVLLYGVFAFLVTLPALAWLRRP